MADVYVWSGATGSGTGANWANAFTTLTAAVVGMAAGSRVFVANDHNESTAGPVFIVFPGTPTNPNQVLCVNRAGSVPPVSADLRTTAIITATGTSTLTISKGSAYFYGITFSNASTGNQQLIVGDPSGAYVFIFDTCTLKVTSTTGGIIALGSSTSTNAVNDSGQIILKNTNCYFNSANAGIAISGSPAIWLGGAVQNLGPTNLFAPGGGVTWLPMMEVRDVDLSLVGASSYLVNASNINTPGFFKFTNCKLSASLGGVMTGTIAGTGQVAIDMIVSDSGTATYREEHYEYSGSIIQETTVVRSGGASDGTTPKSWKMATTSGAAYLLPLTSSDIFQWVPSTGSHTLTIEVINDGVTLKDNEIWMDLEYMGSSSTPLGTYATTASDVLASGASVATSTATWTTTGISSPVKQKLSTTVTINQAGWFRARVNLARASQTVYVDPLATVA